MTQPTSTIRLGIVGVGKIARDQHLPTIANDPRFELVATASPHHHIDGVPAYRTVEEMLSAGHQLDAVSICTPPAGRSLIAIAAIEAGLDVMVEKPPAATLSEMDALERRARACGSVLFTAWHSREASGVEPARQWLEGRKIEQVAIKWREDIRRWHPGQDWILGPGGFGVFDPGINALSIATAILADPIVVESADLEIPAGRQSPLAANVRMRSGEAPVSVELDFLHEGPQQWDIIVETDAGQLNLRLGGSILEVDGSVIESEDREYPRLYSRFASLIEARQSDVNVTPLRLVADSFLLASRQTTAEFEW